MLLGVAAGLVAGIAVLVTAVAAVRALGTAGGVSPSGLAFAGACAVLLAAELFGVAPRLAANRRVPAQWVTPPSARAGAVWGGALGLGLATEAPLVMLHAALAAAVLLASSALVWQVPVAYAAGRLCALALGPLRRAIMRGMDVRVPTSQGDRPLTLLVGLALNRTMLICLTAAAVGETVA